MQRTPPARLLEQDEPGKFRLSPAGKLSALADMLEAFAAIVEAPVVRTRLTQFARMIRW